MALFFRSCPLSFPMSIDKYSYFIITVKKITAAIQASNFDDGSRVAYADCGKSFLFKRFESLRN